MAVPEKASLMVVGEHGSGYEDGSEALIRYAGSASHGTNPNIARRIIPIEKSKL
jgi:hypothetical protein